jgi:phospholipase/carboxylesterase
MSDLGFIHRYEPAPGETPRVLLLLHGTGGNENDMLSLGRELDPKAAILSPRGNVSENGAPRFFRRLAEGVFDEEDVVFRANELADFITAAAKRYEFQTEQLIAVGYSNGANISTAVMLLRPEVLNAAILLRAMVPLTNPPQASLSGKRVLISNGENDPIVPVENTQRLAALLRNRGAEMMLELHKAGHGLVRGDLETAKHWLGT